VLADELQRQFLAAVDTPLSDTCSDPVGTTRTDGARLRNDRMRRRGAS
jgi:hypothetical protein